MINKSDVKGYFDGLNRKLFDALPTAHRILELGCAKGHLGQAYKQKYPLAHWTGVDREVEAIENASELLDATILLDLDEEIDSIDGTFDLIVFGDVIEHIKNPSIFLQKLRSVISENGSLVCCIPNMVHHSVLHRLMIGDFTYDENGLLDETHLRLYSPSSAIKIFLDNGWFPDLVDSYSVGGDDSTVRRLVELAAHLGCSIEAAQRNLLTYQMIFSCKPITQPASSVENSIDPRISVVVPVTSMLQYNLNVARSPGLKEIGAELIPVVNASSAAQAFETGAAKASGDWVIFCHQDMYIPIGSGRALLKELALVPKSDKQTTILGAVGLAYSSNDSYLDADGFRISGRIVDRVNRIDAASSLSVASLDECFIVLSKNTACRIDPNIGWHLWATDLLWQSEQTGRFNDGRTLDIAVFHNSLTGRQLPKEFGEALNYAAAKYPERQSFITLCGVWRRAAAS